MVLQERDPAGLGQADLLRGCSGDVWHGVVGEGKGGIGRPRRVAGGVNRLFRFRVAQAQVFEDAAG